MRSVEMLVIVMGTEVIDGVAKLLGFARAARGSNPSASARKNRDSSLFFLYLKNLLKPLKLN